MKKQVLLWVILSVTLLAILVLGAGLWLLRDKPAGPISQATAAPQTNYFELPLRNTPLPGLVTPAPDTQDSPTAGVQKQDVVIGDTSDTESKAATEKTTVTQATPRPTATPSAKTHPTAAQTGTVQAKSSVMKKPGNLYWIQTGSYKSKSKADACNTVLMENGLAGRIQTKAMGEGTFFRVRIGPYANKAEAAKFLTWIRKINGFEESYILIDNPAKK